MLLQIFYYLFLPSPRLPVMLMVSPLRRPHQSTSRQWPPSKTAAGNTAFAWWFISNHYVLPSRHSALRWRFSPGGVGKILERHFFHLHNISHLERLASRPFFSSRYVWCCLAKEVATLAKTCLHCQQSKIHRHIPICFVSSPWRPYIEDKRMVLEHTHGLFIT